MYSVEKLQEEMVDVPSSVKQGIVRYSPADHNRLLFLKTYKLFTCGIFSSMFSDYLIARSYGKWSYWDQVTSVTDVYIFKKKSGTEMFH